LKNDVTAQVWELLEEKYPQPDINTVVESFDIKLARDISLRKTVAQNQSHVVRVLRDGLEFRARFYTCSFIAHPLPNRNGSHRLRPADQFSRMGMTT
jgi:hypothetical protein